MINTRPAEDISNPCIIYTVKKISDYLCSHVTMHTHKYLLVAPMTRILSVLDVVAPSCQYTHFSLHNHSRKYLNKTITVPRIIAQVGTKMSNEHSGFSKCSRLALSNKRTSYVLDNLT